MKIAALRSAALSVLLGGLLAMPARAGLCDNAVVPAATLLLPYFEVALGDVPAHGTLVTVHNAFAAPALVHVVLWSDLSVPVLGFNVYLTGYDQAEVDLGSILNSGTLPYSASAAQDPDDTISPRGPLSQDVGYASCTGQLPLPSLPVPFLTHLQNALTGHASPVLGGLCAGRDLGDSIARGYVTMDVVNDCTLGFPGDPGYFKAGGTGVASDRNAIFGDYIYLSADEPVQGFPLVHIRASGTDPATSTPGAYTFYGRYVGWSAADNRQPLPTTFGARYMERGDIIVWRDPKVAQAAFSCAGTAVPLPWYPLGEESVVIFDGDENAAVQPTSRRSPEPPGAFSAFAASTQRVSVNGATAPALAMPFSSGWVYMNLNTRVIPAGGNPPGGLRSAQGWTSVILRGGTQTASFDAVHFDSACSANHGNP